MSDKSANKGSTGTGTDEEEDEDVREDADEAKGPADETKRFDDESERSDDKATKSDEVKGSPDEAKESTDEVKESAETEEANRQQQNETAAKKKSKRGKESDGLKDGLDFRQNSSKFDVTLQTKEGNLYCNKAVLIMWFTYFKVRCAQEFRGMRKIQLELDDDVAMDDMEELLRVLYPPNKEINGVFSLILI